MDSLQTLFQNEGGKNVSTVEAGVKYLASAAVLIPARGPSTSVLQLPTYSNRLPKKAKQQHRNGAKESSATEPWSSWSEVDTGGKRDGGRLREIKKYTVKKKKRLSFVTFKICSTAHLSADAPGESAQLWRANVKIQLHNLQGEPGLSHYIYLRSKPMRSCLRVYLSIHQSIQQHLSLGRWAHPSQTRSGVWPVRQ